MTRIEGTVSSTSTHQRLKRISRFMDNSIRLPGGYRIGWDGIVGLIPGVGDLIGMGFSLYILAGAMRLGASKTTLLRMLGNVGLETVIGAVPVVGDLFDIVFKANSRNMKILDKQLADPAGTHRKSSIGVTIFLIVAVLALLLVAWLIAYLVFRLFTWVF